MDVTFDEDGKLFRPWRNVVASWLRAPSTMFGLCLGPERCSGCARLSAKLGKLALSGSSVFWYLLDGATPNSTLHEL